MITTNKQRLATRWILTGAVIAMTAVMLGAFGAHTFKTLFSAERMGWYDTAVHYQMTHAIALIITGLIATASKTAKWLKLAGFCFLGGILFFSGSLYLLAATEIRILGAITPIGGVLLILGWALLAFAARDMFEGESHE